MKGETLTQHDWCSYGKGKFGYRDRCVQSDAKIQEDSHLPAKEHLRLPEARKETQNAFALTALEGTDPTDTLVSGSCETIQF